MAILNATNPRFQIIDSLGNPLVGGKVYVYEAGTTTALTNWTDAVKTSANVQPVVLDSTGSADIWFEQSAKFDVKTSDDVQVEGFPVDNIASNIAGIVTGNFNLATNGSFEIDTTGNGDPDNWNLFPDANATIAIDDTTQVHGQNSLKFDANGSGGGSAYTSRFNVLSGGEIAVQLTYKASIATCTCSAGIEWYTEDFSFISATILLNDSTTNPLTFTTKNYTATAPATATNAFFYFDGVGSGGGQLSADAWLDDVIIQGASSSVTLKATQTLENKTLISPTITNFAGSVITSHGVIATTSGVAATFGSIPSWAKKITLMLDGVSTNGTSGLIVYIGDAGGLETSGYLSASFFSDGTTHGVSTDVGAFRISNPALTIASVHQGSLTFVLLDPATNTWVMQGALYDSNAGDVITSSGTKSLSATLTQISLTTVSTDTFDAGKANILYEG